MKLKIKIALARMRQTAQKWHKQAQKIALAVVVTEYLIAGGWYYAENKGILDHFRAKNTITIINTVKASPKITLEAPKQPQNEPESVERIVDIIYQLESSSGQNDAKCERLGANSHNGYGYRQGISRNFCLASDNEVRKLVIDWIKEKQAQNLTENQLLCLYNTGTASDNCDYSQNAQKLK